MSLQQVRNANPTPTVVGSEEDLMEGGALHHDCVRVLTQALLVDRACGDVKAICAAFVEAGGEKNPLAQLLCGELLLKQTQFAEALPWFERAGNAGVPEAMYKAAQLCLQQERQFVAFGWLQKALLVDPDPTDVGALVACAYAFERGFGADSMRNKSKAREFYRAAAKLGLAS